ncbi:MAG: GTP-binding protein [Caldilineaceae bacterium]
MTEYQLDRPRHFLRNSPCKPSIPPARHRTFGLFGSGEDDAAEPHSQQYADLRVAVIVNDMSEINIDAAWSTATPKSSAAPKKNWLR